MIKVEVSEKVNKVHKEKVEVVEVVEAEVTANKVASDGKTGKE